MRIVNGYGFELMRSWQASGFCIRLYDTHHVQDGKYVVEYRFHDAMTGVREESQFPVGMGTAIDADDVMEHCVSCVLDNAEALDGYGSERADTLRQLLEDMRNEEHKGEYWKQYHATHDDE